MILEVAILNVRDGAGATFEAHRSALHRSSRPIPLEWIGEVVEQRAPALIFCGLPKADRVVFEPSPMHQHYGESLITDPD